MLAQPVVALHESVVQAMPSSHDCVVPTHCPAEHFFGSDRVSPAHDAAAHCTPSVPLVQEFWLLLDVQTWQELFGFACPLE